jgi:hypothetical protein
MHLIVLLLSHTISILPRQEDSTNSREKRNHHPRIVDHIVDDLRLFSTVESSTFRYIYITCNIDFHILIGLSFGIIIIFLIIFLELFFMRLNHGINVPVATK